MSSIIIKNINTLINKLNSQVINKINKSGDSLTGDLILSNNHEIKLSELALNGSNYISVKAPSSLSSNFNFVLPNSNGTNGYVLSTDGSGNLSWISNPSLAINNDTNSLGIGVNTLNSLKTIDGATDNVVIGNYTLNAFTNITSPAIFLSDNVLIGPSLFKDLINTQINSFFSTNIIGKTLNYSNINITEISYNNIFGILDFKDSSIVSNNFAYNNLIGNFEIYSISTNDFYRNNIVGYSIINSNDFKLNNFFGTGNCTPIPNNTSKSTIINNTIFGNGNLYTSNNLTYTNVCIFGNNNLIKSNGDHSSNNNDIVIGNNNLRNANSFNIPNLIIGNSCLQALTTGTLNICISPTGRDLNSSPLLITGSSNIFIGDNFIENEGSNNIIIGSKSGTGDFSGTFSDTLILGSKVSNMYIGDVINPPSLQVASTIALHINATTGQVTRASSSKRYKTNISYDIDSSIVDKFKIASYNYKSDLLNNNIGLIAEDIYDLSKDLVLYIKDKETNTNIPEAVKYESVFCLLIDYVQKLEKRIKILEVNLK